MDIRGLITHYARIYGVDPELALRVAKVESGFNPKAISPKGAIGIMQLMPDTAKMLGVDPYDVEQNIEGGVRYLSGLINQFGDVNLALAAYNAGPEAVKRYGGVPPYQETKQYIRKVSANIPQDNINMEVLMQYFPEDYEVLTRQKIQETPKPKQINEEEILRQYFPEEVPPQIPVEPVKKEEVPFLASVGKGMMLPFQALKQLWYGITDSDKLKQYTEQLKAEEKAWQETYTPTFTSKAGEFLGNVAALLPLGVITPASIPGLAAVGGLSGVLTPATEDNFWQTKAAQGLLGAGIGAATGLAGKGIQKLFSKPTMVKSPSDVEAAQVAASNIGIKLTPGAEGQGAWRQQFEAFLARSPYTATAGKMQQHQFAINRTVNKALRNIEMPTGILDDDVAQVVNKAVQEQAKALAKEPNFVSDVYVKGIKNALNKGYSVLDEKKNTLAQNLIIDMGKAKELLNAVDDANKVGAVITKDLNYIIRDIKKNIIKGKSEAIEVEPIQITNLIKTLNKKVDDYYSRGLGAKAKSLKEIANKLNELFPENIKQTEQVLNQYRAFINILDDPKVIREGNIDMHALAQKVSEYSHIVEPYKSIYDIAKIYPTQREATGGFFEAIMQSPVFGVPFGIAMRAAEIPYYAQLGQNISKYALGPITKPISKILPTTAQNLLPLSFAISGGKIGASLLD